MGKTFCAGYAIGSFKVKTLIIVHRDSLRTQWVNSLCKMNGFGSKDIHEIVSTDEIFDIVNGYYKPSGDVFLITHATFRASLPKVGSLKAMEKFTENLGIGLKIIDEAHLEFRDTLTMDAIMNVKRNIYMTATNARSAKEENAIFKYAFSKTIFYKESATLHDDHRPKKWVDYITVAVNTHCNPNIYRYRVVGSKSMNPATYGRWVIKHDKNQTHFKVCRDLVRQTFNEDPHSKMIIFMPLIDLCDELQEFISKSLNNDDSFDYELNIQTMHSRNSKSDNDYAKHADIIVTTIGSAGTGTDIPGITDIICCSPFVSRVTCSQVFGRIRYIPKKCHYYDIYDESVLMDKIWMKARSKTLRPLALNSYNLYWSES